MFEHVVLRASDRAASERFYEAVLPALGLGVADRGAELTRWGDLRLATAAEPRAATRRLHVGFAAASRDDVEAFWQAGVAAGFRSDGEPGPRPQYVEDYYGAFLLDPDGNSVEAMRYTGARDPGRIDHLWLRVTDVGASARFYDAVAPSAGYRNVGGRGGRVTFRAATGRGSFSIVPADDAWPVTEHAHLAFPGARGDVLADPDGTAIELVDRGT